MKIYHELYGFYILFVLLGILLIILTILLCVVKAQKKKNEAVLKTTASSDDFVEIINDGEKSFEFGKEDSVQENTFGDEDDLIIDVEILFEEIIDLPDATFDSTLHVNVQNDDFASAVTKGSNEENLRDSIEKMLDGYAKEGEYKERYRVIREKLNHREKYSFAYEGLLAKLNRIEKEFLLLQQAINSESDIGKIELVASVLDGLLSEIERDITALPLLIELSHITIPRKINEISNEYKKLKYNGLVVDEEVPNILKDMSATLSKCLAKIKRIDLDGLLEQLIDIVKSLDGVNVKNINT